MSVRHTETPVSPGAEGTQPMMPVTHGLLGASVWRSPSEAVWTELRQGLSEVGSSRVA